MTLLLTHEERDRFAEWLEAEAETDDALAEQMDKMDHPFSGEWRANAAAKRRVARQLRGTEDVSL